MARITLVWLVVAVLALMALACSAGEERSPGEEIVQTRCRACHSLDKVRSAQKDRETWQLTVERMRRYGAQLTDDETTTLVEYLATANE